ncbi:MAG: multiheme c-type cytochrome [Ferruginibacter sp.]
MNIKSFHITRYKLVIFLLVVFVWSISIIFNSCKNNSNKYSGIIHPNGKQFAGSETCKGCHKNIYESHWLTAHSLSSRPGSVSTIKGSFDDGQNVFELNRQWKVKMEKNAAGLFQVGYVNGHEVARQLMDIVIGSGTKGQTYLYWYGNSLFQLPISYYKPLNTWCNSPGFPTDQIMFNRTIPARCLECHTTNFKKTGASADVDEFDKTQVIYGVDCERCHGPSAEHVAFQTANPDEKKAKFTINPALLSRQQQLDNCALCHSGLRENSKQPFSFVTGDKLDDYSTPDYKPDSTVQLDVHGNQYGLLTASKCFKMSNINCSSCHNVHVNEANNPALFSQRCMNCHNDASHNFCKQPATQGLVLKNNCIDCHMPALPSKKIFLEVADKAKSTPDLVRTHLISIYKEQTKSYLQKIKKEKSFR